MSDSLGVRGQIDVSIYDSSLFSDGLSEKEQLERAQSIEPDRTVRASNVTCIGMHEYFVDNLDPEQSRQEEALACALGDDDSASASSSDTSLNNEIFRKSYTNTSDNGNELLISTYFDEGEVNNVGVVEVGLFTDTTGGTLLNHSLINEISKTSAETMTIDVTLTFEAL